MTTPTSIDIPDELIASYHKTGAAGQAWVARLPMLAADFLDRWKLQRHGPASYGMGSLVLPVVCADGSRAALKLQQVTEDTVDAALAFRTWNSNDVVQLLDYDLDTGTTLLEWLDPNSPLSSVTNDTDAVQILAELLTRLVAVPAPPGIRRLADIAAAMLDRTPHAVQALSDPAEQKLMRTCAAIMAELIDKPGDRLLHWDLHYDNILAGERKPWLAIDPQPLAGDPGFELLPALDNRWDDVVAAGDIARAVLYRFDLLTEVLALDRQRAIGWTLGRVLQNALWDIQDGETTLNPEQVTIAETLLRR